MSRSVRRYRNVGQVSKPRSSLRRAAMSLLAVFFLYVASMFVYRLFNGMPFDPMATAYVSIEPADSDRFLDDLAAIANSHGLKAWKSSAAPNDGPTFYVLEASGRALNIWAQNVPLSGEECGRSGSPTSNTGQFVVHVLPSMWLPLRGRATALFKSVSGDLSTKGYHIAAEPSVSCN